MSHTDTSTSAHAARTPRRARVTGLAVAAAGVVVLNIAPFLSWTSTGEEGTERNDVSGYETDSLIPFIAYLGIGLLLAMLYARKRSDRGQHRGLTLVSMAVAVAAVLQFLAFAVDSMGGLERGYDLEVQLGAYVALIGAAIWAIGSGLLAKEVEGDDDHDALGTADHQH